MTVSLLLSGKDTGLFVHDTIIQLNKKQSEELKSSKLGLINTNQNIYSVQTSEVVRDEADGETTEQVTTTFDKGENSTITLEGAVGNWYTPTNTADSDVADFLRRPVNLKSYTWNIGSTIDHNFDPWYDYFNTPAIKYKIHNYAFLRCDLHIKVMINASPFYYSALLCSYNPQGGGLGSAPVDSGANFLVPYSQRAHFYLYPQESEGSEMILPYLNPSEWIEIGGTLGTNLLKNMGTFHIDSIVPLKTANSIAGVGINIEVYCWAENVQLAGLTVDLAVQSGKGVRDEYSMGPVSKIASAIARGSDLLSQAPVIGSYMTATSFAATAVSSIASTFGYTKVPVIGNIQAFKNLPFHGLSTSDQPDVTEKLSLDSKNELTIDNTVIGDTQEDSLCISNFVQRSSYLDQFTWQASDAPGTLLWNSFVSPVLFSQTIQTYQNIIQGTPMWLASTMFNSWRGDVIFDFKILCTKFHRGRLRFSWDPTGNISNTLNSTSMVFNHIMDITEDTSVSIRVPYIAATSYLDVSKDLADIYYTTVPLVSTSLAGVNGILTVRVLNDQTSPVAAADIVIMASVRGAENLEFANPQQIDDTINFYTVQSEEITMGAPSSVDSNVNLVYMGETIKSFRELMQRCNHSITWGEVISNSITQVKSVWSNRRPLYRGFDPQGVHQAVGNQSALTEQFNFVTTSPYHLITSCFLGERGSITWKVNNDALAPTSITLSRSNRLLVASGYNPKTPTNHYTVTDTSWYSANVALFNETNFGMSLTNQRTNTGVSVNIPMYSKYTMLETKPSARTLGLYPYTTQDSFHTSWVSQEFDTTTPGVGSISFYFQCGPDHSLVYFNNVPSLYIYNNPTPV